MRCLSGPDQEWLWAEMAHAVHIGRPLAEGLRELAEVQPRTARGKTARTLAEALTSGKTLSQAVAETRAFALGAAEAIEAGERGGCLEPVLDALAEEARTETGLRASLVHAIAYPLVIAGAALVAMAFLQSRVVPLFDQMFVDLDVELPALTQFALDGVIIEAFGAIAICGLIVMGLYLLPGGVLLPRSLHDRLRLRIPMLGHALRRLLLARWCGTMALLTRAGVPEPRAVLLAGRSTGHAEVEDWSRRLSEDTERGKPLSGALEPLRFFQPPLVWMVAASRAAGGQAAVWPVARDLYRCQGERLAYVASILLRILFILLALQTVGITVLAMFLPLIRIMNCLGG